MAKKLKILNDNIFYCEGFWDKEICQTIIFRVEESQIFPAKETVVSQNTLDDNLQSRNNFKVYLDNQELADIIYESLYKHLAKIKHEEYSPSSIHSNLRVYKYIPGQEFKKHRDGGIGVSKEEKSLYSLLIYLNDNFSGGSTRFNNIDIIPKQGSALFFPHELEHSGEIVSTGNKYVLRGNIVFKKNKL